MFIIMFLFLFFEHLSGKNLYVFSRILRTYSSGKVSLLDLIYIIVFDQQGNRNLIKNQQPQLMRYQDNLKDKHWKRKNEMMMMKVNGFIFVGRKARKCDVLLTKPIYPYSL